MRVIVFYIYLSFLLLCGGNYLYADSHHKAASFSFNQNLEKKQQVKHRNSNHRSEVNTDADIDFDEEFHSSDEFKIGSPNKFLGQKQSFLDSWNSKSSHQFNLNFYSKSFKIFAPLSVYSNPIYIRMGVLRI